MLASSSMFSVAYFTKVGRMAIATAANTQPFMKSSPGVLEFKWEVMFLFGFFFGVGEWMLIGPHPKFSCFLSAHFFCKLCVNV